MMEDKWKEVFRENKEKIQDEFALPKGHEDRFLAKLQQRNKKVNRPFNYWKVAAIFIPICMLATYFFLEFNPNSGKEEQPQTILASYSPDLNEAENHFSYIVQQKVDEVKSLQTPENKTFINKSLKSLNELQTDYNRLLIDLKESGGNSQVVKSILLNLQLQVDLLESVLTQIETIQEIKTKQDETI
jgi:hypothetical protein